MDARSNPHRKTTLGQSHRHDWDTTQRGVRLAKRRRAIQMGALERTLADGRPCAAPWGFHLSSFSSRLAIPTSQTWRSFPLTVAKLLPSYPLKSIDEVVDEVSCNVVFTSLDG